MLSLGTSESRKKVCLGQNAVALELELKILAMRQGTFLKLGSTLLYSVLQIWRLLMTRSEDIKGRDLGCGGKHDTNLSMIDQTGEIGPGWQGSG